MTESIYDMCLFISGSPAGPIIIKNVTKPHATDIIKLLDICWIYFKEQHILSANDVGDLFGLTPEQKQMLHNYEGSDISIWNNDGQIWEFDSDKVEWKEVKCEPF